MKCEGHGGAAAKNADNVVAAVKRVGNGDSCVECR